MTTAELRVLMQQRNQELQAQGGNFRLSHQEGAWTIVCAGCGEPPHDPMCPAPAPRTS